MDEKQLQLKWVEDAPQPRQEWRREIEREEWERPAESDAWRNWAFFILSLATAAGIAALSFADPVRRAVFLTASVFLLIGGIGCFFVDRAVNRGRRPKRTLLVERLVERSRPGPFTDPPKHRRPG